MDSSLSKALSDVQRAFPAAKFRYEFATDCLVAEHPNGLILVDNSSPLVTEGLGWEASFGTVDVLAENPVRAVRLLCERAGLKLEGI